MISIGMQNVDIGSRRAAAPHSRPQVSRVTAALGVVTPDATTRASKSLTLYIRATVAKSAVLAVRAPGGWRALGPS